MLKSGPELGTAIRAALETVGLRGPAAVSREFGVKPPSVSGWFSTGRISKSNLIEIIQRTRGNVPLNHWGDERSTDALLGLGMRAREPRQKAAANAAETKLLAIYRALELRQRERLLAYAEGLADQAASRTKQTNNAA